MFSERFADCVLSSFEGSDVGQAPIDSRNVIDTLGLNMTLTVGLL